MTTLKIFSAPWCCNCKTVKMMLKDVPMEVVNADDENNTPIYDAANVQSIPTIIAYDEPIFDEDGDISDYKIIGYDFEF